MTTPPASAELAKLLDRLKNVDGLREDVAAALGVAAPSVAEDAGVLAMHSELGDVMLQLFLLTDAALVIYQRTREGRTLTVTVPVSRMSRVAVEAAPAGEDASGNAVEASLALTLELDADQVTGQLDQEYLEEPVGGEGRRRGSARSLVAMRRSGYVLRASGDGCAQLRGFQSQLAMVMHRR